MTFANLLIDFPHGILFHLFIRKQTNKKYRVNLHVLFQKFLMALQTTLQYYWVPIQSFRFNFILVSHSIRMPLHSVKIIRLRLLLRVALPSLL